MNRPVMSVSSEYIHGTRHCILNLVFRHKIIMFLIFFVHSNGINLLVIYNNNDNN